jgi:Activator of Hsp90 ATPase homolog 1-like protein
MSNKTVSVRVVRRFKASPERVFDAWLDPNTARKFLFTDAHGEVIRCEIEPRVGGKFLIVDRRTTEDTKYTGDIEHIGEYLTTQVSIEILPIRNGCELSLTHTGVLPEYEKDTNAGWNLILDGLAGILDQE